MGKAPKAPPPPQPSAEERALQVKQGKAIDAYLSSLDEQKRENKALGLLTQVSSGLYDPVYGADGSLVDAKLNQGAVDSLRADISKSREIGLLQADRLEKALKGELPVSEATLTRKNEEFRLLKESAARQGIDIVGDTVDEAFSTPQNSTAAGEAVNRFKRTYGLLEDAERRGEIANVSGVNLGVPTLSLASTATNYGAGSTAPGYAQGAGLLGQAQQPFQFNRQLQYNTDMTNAQLRSQERAGVYGLGAGLLGLGGGYLAGR